MPVIGFESVSRNSMRVDSGVSLARSQKYEKFFLFGNQLLRLVFHRRSVPRGQTLVHRKARTVGQRQFRNNVEAFWGGFGIEDGSAPQLRGF
jgi:hypothetical protein